MKHSLIFKTLALMLSVSFFLEPVGFALAQSSGTFTNSPSGVVTGSNSNTPGDVYKNDYQNNPNYQNPNNTVNGGDANTSSFQSPNAASTGAVSVVESAATCYLSGFVGKILGSVSSITSVPTSDRTTQSNTGALTTKQCLLDGIVWALKQAIIAEITNSIVDWINSGFEGSPAFVTDLNGFLYDVADQAAGEFIYGSNLNALCSPFAPEIRLALALGRTNRNRYACTLTGVVRNLQDFLGGDFYSGGWDGFFQYNAYDQNNPYGAYLATQSGLDSYTANQVALRQTQLGWGNGILSKTHKQCYSYPDGSQSCRDVVDTPGSVIGAQLNNVLPSGLHQLELADSFNEIVSALLGQLVQQVFTGVRGLAGLNQNYNYQPSYLSQTVSQTGQTATQNEASQNTFYIEDAAQTEYQYISYVKATQSALLNSQTLLQNEAACWAKRATTSSYSGAMQNAQNASTTIATQITPQLAVTSTKIYNSDTYTQYLSHLADELTVAKDTNTINAINTQFEDAQHLGGHNQQDIIIAQNDYQITKDALTTLDDSTRNALSACQNYSSTYP